MTGPEGDLDAGNLAGKRIWHGGECLDPSQPGWVLTLALLLAGSETSEAP